MSTEENKRVVLRFLDDAVGGRADILDEICAADFYNHAAPERARGVQGLKDVVAFSLRAQPDQHWTERHVIAEGDLVVVYGVREATWQAAAFRGFATGQAPVAVELAHMFRITDGRISAHWAVRDDLGMLQQLGSLTTP